MMFTEDEVKLLIDQAHEEGLKFKGIADYHKGFEEGLRYGRAFQQKRIQAQRRELRRLNKKLETIAKAYEFGYEQAHKDIELLKEVA